MGSQQPYKNQKGQVLDLFAIADCPQRSGEGQWYGITQHFLPYPSAPAFLSPISGQRQV